MKDKTGIIHQDMTRVFMKTLSTLLIAIVNYSKLFLKFSNLISYIKEFYRGQFHLKSFHFDIHNCNERVFIL